MLFFNTCELGGFSARVEQRIRQGIMRPFRMRTRDDVNNSLSFETLHLASKGYLPARFTDPFTGEVEPGVPMVPPVTTIYTQTCPKCATVVRRTRFYSKCRSNTCPKCRTTVTQQTAPPTVEVKQTAGFEQIGSLGFDGLTSASDWLLQDMSHRTNLEGEKAALGGDIQSGDISFRGNNRSQVGMAQTRIHELVANSLGIPNLVVMPVWTAISHESSDDTGRLVVIGPKLAGDAKTYIASSWFGNVVEAQLISTRDHGGEYTRRLYISQWYDEHNRRHLCGHRGDPRFLPQYFEDAPYSDEKPPEEMCTGFSLNFFQRQLEESIVAGNEADDFKGPGIATIPGSYGEDEAVPVGEEAGAAAARPVAGPRTSARRARPRVGAAAPSTPAETPAEVPPQPQEPPQEPPPAEPPPVEETPETPETPASEVEPGEVPDEQVEAPAAPPVQAATSAQPAIAAPGVAAQPGTWTRPPGTRPSVPSGPPPRAPQSGPKAPARSAPRPVAAVKPQ